MSKIIFDFWPRATSEVGSEVTLDLIWLITWSNGVVRGVGNELVELAELSSASFEIFKLEPQMGT